MHHAQFHEVNEENNMQSPTVMIWPPCKNQGDQGSSKRKAEYICCHH